MKILPFEQARQKCLDRRANGLRGRHVRTLHELAEEFGTTYQKLAFEMKKHPAGVPASVESHTSNGNKFVKRYDLLLMRAWWKGLQK